jgi:hypothetical protein
MCAHLAKRGSRYFLRRKILLDLLPYYSGKEIMRSLGTSDRRDDERFVRIIDVELDRETSQNINMHLALLIKLLNYAERPDLIKTNEVSCLTLKASGSENARKSFDLPALKSIFSCAIDTAGRRAKGGGDDVFYWLPLLALFTGARLGKALPVAPRRCKSSTVSRRRRRTGPKDLGSRR